MIMLPRIHAISHMARASYIPVHQAHAARSTMITTAATSLNAAAFARPGGALIESTSSVKVRMIPACRAPLSIGCLRRIHLLPLAWGAVTALLPISRECFSRGPLSLWYHLNPVGTGTQLSRNIPLCTHTHTHTHTYTHTNTHTHTHKRTHWQNTRGKTRVVVPIRMKRPHPTRSGLAFTSSGSTQGRPRDMHLKHIHTNKHTVT